MRRKVLLVLLGCALLFVGVVPSAHATTTIQLVLPQGDAFTVLGHSCGGIQEQTYATGFDPSSGYPTGAVYAKTSCGGSGRGGGYTVTTYKAWIDVTWYYEGEVVSYAKATTAQNVDPAFTAFDVYGNEVYNASYNAYLTLASGFVPTPRVTAVSGSAGPASGGTSVTITGDGFTNATAVNFGGAAASNYTINSDTSITAISPSATAGPVDVTVASAGGTSATTSADTFAFVAAPTVSGLSPNTGPISGGTPVTITGTGFTGATAVSFGGNLSGFTVNSDTSITAIAPAVETADVIDVTVTTVGGTSATNSADQYTYGAMGGCTGTCVSVGDASILEGDTGTRTLTFPVTLSQPSNTTVTVDYAVTDGTATGGAARAAGIDYQTKTGTLTFTPNTTTGLTPVEKWVTVSVYGDTVVEPDETLLVTLTNVSGNYDLGRTVGTGTILNDDGIATGITAGIGDSAIVVASSGTQALKLPVTLSKAAASTVTINYTVTPDPGTVYSATKAGGGNYGGKTSGMLTFLAGTASKTISIPIWPNANPTGNTGFTITLSNPTGPITVIRETGTGSILGG